MVMPSELPDKDFLYGVFQKTEDWKDNLHRKLSHKALDIADDTDVNVDNSRMGIGWKELLVLAGAGLGGFYLYDRNQNQNPPSPPVQSAPIDSEYDVRFYDASGNLIDVQPLPRTD